jgi:hypothetical protein
MITLRFVVRAWPAMLAILATSGWAVSAGRLGGASAARTGPPLTPRLPDSGDVALALSAAPASVSAAAAVYVLRDGKFVKVREGTNGFACAVFRDTRNNSVAPECFDPEAARTMMQEEIMQAQLQARGLSDKAIEHEIDAAYQRGTLHNAEHGGIIYMMSSKQQLPPSPEAQTPLTAWHPHIMIYIPHASKAQFALGAENEAMPVSTPFKGDDKGVLLVVQVPHWADSPVATADASEHH